MSDKRIDYIFNKSKELGFDIDENHITVCKDIVFFINLNNFLSLSIGGNNLQYSIELLIYQLQHEERDFNYKKNVINDDTILYKVNDDHLIIQREKSHVIKYYDKVVISGILLSDKFPSNFLKKYKHHELEMQYHFDDNKYTEKHNSFIETLRRLCNRENNMVLYTNQNGEYFLYVFYLYRGLDVIGNIIVEYNKNMLQPYSVYDNYKEVTPLDIIDKYDIEKKQIQYESYKSEHIMNHGPLLNKNNNEGNKKNAIMLDSSNFTCLINGKYNFDNTKIIIIYDSQGAQFYYDYESWYNAKKIYTKKIKENSLRVNDFILIDCNSAVVI